MRRSSSVRYPPTRTPARRASAGPLRTHRGSAGPGRAVDGPGRNFDRDTKTGTGRAGPGSLTGTRDGKTGRAGLGHWAGRKHRLGPGRTDSKGVRAALGQRAGPGRAGPPGAPELAWGALRGGLAAPARPAAAPRRPGRGVSRGPAGRASARRPPGRRQSRRARPGPYRSALRPPTWTRRLSPTTDRRSGQLDFADRHALAGTGQGGGLRPGGCRRQSLEAAKIAPSRRAGGGARVRPLGTTLRQHGWGGRLQSLDGTRRARLARSRHRSDGVTRCAGWPGTRPLPRPRSKRAILSDECRPPPPHFLSQALAASQAGARLSHLTRSRE